MKMKGYTPEGQEQVYDVFVHNDPSFKKPNPGGGWMEVTDGTVVEVRWVDQRYSLG